MKSAAKWLIAGGALLLVIAFILPVISAASNSTKVSLLQMAGGTYLFILYLFPLGALTTLILTLVPAKYRTTKRLFLIGQVLGLGSGFLLLVGILIYFLFWSLSEQDPLRLGSILPAECQVACEIWPGIGFFVLLFGFGLAVLGLLIKYFRVFGGVQKQQASQALAPEAESLPGHEIEFIASHPQLEFMEGESANHVVTISGDNFSIGRSKVNQLQLSDPGRNISRVHARLRFAQDAWYIQDQDSKIGTFVNSKRIKATRLESGDEIRIGQYTFYFRN